jgi:hypothetical protein
VFEVECLAPERLHDVQVEAIDQDVLDDKRHDEQHGRCWPAIAVRSGWPKSMALRLGGGPR